jgi:pre-mRNA-splicing factor ATP-dependent RNA helicase DHX38/PRP16
MTINSFESALQLPVHDFQEQIVSSVDNNQVTIITAETGAGKSTQIPQYLAEHGYQKIIVTQPRILAARNLCMRVRQEYSWRQSKDATDLVGYRTANERDDNSDNIILYCTDGLQLVRELTGIGTTQKQVLVLDEIHEWNENMEVLIAWAKKRCLEDPHFKVVLMSATIEANSLAAYFGSPPPIAVPGRTFDVEKRHSQDLISEIMRQLETRASNMLVFLPGKAEIEAVSEAIADMANKRHVPVLPLHSQLSIEAQQQAFASYPTGKVVLATNVAQTSITIDDIDVVIDSGLERRAEVQNGVEGLFITEVSQADCLQRAGRAGRTKEGLYVLAQLGQLPCAKLEDRPEYGVPEIMRKHIDRLVLRLAAIGIDIEDLEFYHAPSRRAVKLAKTILVSLGAIDKTGTVTDIGHRMERFPVESSYARMLVEAECHPIEVQAPLASIIAIQEVGGIVKGSPRYSGWKQFTRQTQSDLLAQYDVYLHIPDVDPLEYEDLGIIEKNITKSLEVNERLNRDLGLGAVAPLPIADEHVEDILRCIVAGQLHQIWLLLPTGEATHIDTGQTRELSSGSVVRRHGIATGTAFDLEVPLDSGGLQTLHLVNDATSVNPTWLVELAPDLFSVRTGKKYFDSYTGMLLTRTLVTYKHKAFETAGTAVVEHTKDNHKLFTTLYGLWLRDRLEEERRPLERANPRLPKISARDIQHRVHRIAPDAISVVELSKQQRVSLASLTKLETYLGRRFMSTLNRPIERESQHQHRRGHGWQPRHKRKHDRH